MNSTATNINTRFDATVARSSSTFLTKQLSGTFADFAAVFGFMRALTLIGLELFYIQIDGMIIGFNPKYGRWQLYGSTRFCSFFV